MEIKSPYFPLLSNIFCSKHLIFWPNFAQNIEPRIRDGLESPKRSPNDPSRPAPPSSQNSTPNPKMMTPTSSSSLKTTLKNKAHEGKPKTKAEQKAIVNPPLKISLSVSSGSIIR